MTQTYRNCNAGKPQVLTPAYVDAGGQITVLVDKAALVPVGEAWHWNFQRTDVGVNYSTAKYGLSLS